MTDSTPLGESAGENPEVAPAVPPLPLLNAESPALDSATPGRAGIPADILNEPVRLISGIDLVDFSLGGLTPERVYVVKGAIGMGKTIVGLQFLSRGLELQEPGILITAQRPEHVLEQARAVGFHVDEAVKRGHLLILNPSKRYFELVESPADVSAIMEELGDHIRSMGAKRLVIDPVYTLVNTTYSGHFALSVTQTLMNALEELPVTTILTASDEGNPELTPVVSTLEKNCYGVVTLAPDKLTGGRLMRISKLRGAPTDHLAAHYRILDGRGLMNYRGEDERNADATKPWDETSEVRRSVLVIGAQPDVIGKVVDALGPQYTVSAETDLERGIERAHAERPGLVLITPSRERSSLPALLDIARNSTSSVAFLSPTTNRTTDKIIYLRAGADDFITEPFSPRELKARVDALIRRSGRRLNVPDSPVARVEADELNSLFAANATASQKSRKEVLEMTDREIKLDPEFDDRMKRNIDTAAKLDIDFTLYWIKAKEKDPSLNRSLARLCRKEDILCHNANGEFVAILTATDEDGLKGFETRLDDQLGRKLREKNVERGFAVHHAGDSADELLARALRKN